MQVYKDFGGVAAEGIYSAVQEENGKFMSIDDFQIKSKAGKAIIEMLTKFGCFKRNEQKQSNKFVWLKKKDEYTSSFFKILQMYYIYITFCRKILKKNRSNDIVVMVYTMVFCIIKSINGRNTNVKK